MTYYLDDEIYDDGSYPSYDPDVEVVMEQKTYDHLVDHLKSLLKQIYFTGDLNQLENHLEEVVKAFDLDLPDLKPKIQKKYQSENNIFKEAVEQTRAYAEYLCN